MPDLPEGVFSAAFTHPRLDSLNVVLPGVEVRVTSGEFTPLTLAVPSLASLLSSTCTEEELAQGRAVVIGFVRKADTEAPVGGASVSITWSTFEERSNGNFVERRQGLQTTSDGTGRYSACGIPLDTALLIQATHLDRETEPVESWGMEDGYTVVHLVFPGEEPTSLPPSFQRGDPAPPAR